MCLIRRSGGGKRKCCYLSGICDSNVQDYNKRKWGLFRWDNLGFVWLHGNRTNRSIAKDDKQPLEVLHHQSIHAEQVRNRLAGIDEEEFCCLLAEFHILLLGTKSLIDYPSSVDSWEEEMIFVCAAPRNLYKDRLYWRSLSLSSSFWALQLWLRIMNFLLLFRHHKFENNLCSLAVVAGAVVVVDSNSFRYLFRCLKNDILGNRAPGAAELHVAVRWLKSHANAIAVSLDCSFCWKTWDDKYIDNNIDYHY